MGVLCTPENLVRNGPAERCDAAAIEVGKRTKARSVGVANREHFAKLVIRDRRGERRAARWRVLDTAQANFSIVAGYRLIDGAERDEHEPRRPPQASRDELGDLDVESD